ncbi:PorV/PorQ family protein [Candidatus Fermentibacteria bacterium]|nr:PorV/PorQ family protein [Candidatus Fermentibacteria bacterium]
MNRTPLRVTCVAMSALLLLCPGAQARIGGAGTQFLSMGAGARSIGMGSAVSALGGDLESVYWNPAGIALIEGTAAGFTHTMLYADMSLEDAAVAVPAMDGVIGISGLAFLSGKIDETTEEMPDGTGETFSANAMAVTVSYARMMTDKFSAGLSFRVIREALADVSATSWGFDLGGAYNVGWNLRLGFAVANFGPDMQLSGDALEQTWGNDEWSDTQKDDVPTLLQSEPYPMPMAFRAGMAYDLSLGTMGMLTACVEGSHPVDQDETLALGAQYGYDGRYFLRAGYNTINNMQWSAGAGVRIPAGGTDLSVDYCYQQHEYLNGVHRLAVGVWPK